MQVGKETDLALPAGIYYSGRLDRYVSFVLAALC